LIVVPRPRPFAIIGMLLRVAPVMGVVRGFHRNAAVAVSTQHHSVREPESARDKRCEAKQQGGSGSQGRGHRTGKMLPTLLERVKPESP